MAYEANVRLTSDRWHSCRITPKDPFFPNANCLVVLLCVWFGWMTLPGGAHRRVDTQNLREAIPLPHCFNLLGFSQPHTQSCAHIYLPCFVYHGQASFEGELDGANLLLRGWPKSTVMALCGMAARLGEEPLATVVVCSGTACQFFCLVLLTNMSHKLGNGIHSVASSISF